MREKIESLLLAFLVIMSMYLSYILWVSFPQTSAFMKKSTTLEVDLFHIMMPEYVAVNFGGAYHTFVEDEDLSAKIWSEVVKAAFNIKESKIDVADKSVWDKSDEDMSAHIYMGKGISANLLSGIFTGRDSLFKKLNNNVYLNEIIVDVKNNTLFIKDNINKKYYRFYFTYSTDRLKSLMSDLRATKPTVYTSIYENGYDSYFDKNILLPLKPNQVMLTNLYNRESFNTNQYKRLVERMFVNLSVVREIKEDGGSLVYTDGLRSLRLYKNGYVEFYSTSSEVLSTDEISSLKNTAVFLDEMGIKLERIYLCGVDDDNSQYTFYFNYIADFPIRILKDNKGTAPIIVNISNGAVKSASIQYLNPIKGEAYNKHIISADDVIGIVSQKSKVYGKIEDLKIIYLYNKGYFIPAWSLAYKNQQYFIDAFDGQLIN